MQELREFRECGSVLYIAAHPDDENTQFIAYMAKERAMRTGYLSLTRGEGGQDLIGPEIGDPLGVIRTQELLAARRIDGGQQFFTRAKDFGFSKDYEQTLAKWDRQEVLSDVVRVIRAVPAGRDRHAFPAGAAAARMATTRQARCWRWKRSSSRATRRRFPNSWCRATTAHSVAAQAHFLECVSRRGTDRPRLRLDIGGYLPLLGESVGEIAALSRSSHRSQGYGSIASRGSRLDEFQPLDGQPAGKDLFDGIDTTWSRWPAWSDIWVDRQMTIIARFDPQNPASSVPALLLETLRDAHPDVGRDEHGPAYGRKTVERSTASSRDVSASTWKRPCRRPRSFRARG